MRGFNVCKNCFRPGHREKFCKLTHCKYCTHKHNSLLHKHVQYSTQEHNTVLSSKNINQPNILLSTALVNVVGADGNLYPARALLDNGSTGHYVTRHFCERLGLARRNVSSTVTGINNQISYSAESCNLSIETSLSDYKINIECYVLPQITNSLPFCNVNIESIQLPLHIKLADPTFNISSPIDILMGADVFWDVICPNFIDLGKQRPKLQQTKLGWLVCGTISKNTNNINTSSSCFLSQNDDALLTRFWELDSIIPKYKLSLEEQACEKSFAENTKRDFPLITNTHSGSNSEIILHITSKQNSNKDIQTDTLHNFIKKQSNYSHLIRSFAYIKRFIYNCKNPKTKLINFLTTTQVY